MNELDLYKFIQKYNIEYHWHYDYFLDDSIAYKDVIMMVDLPFLQEFYQILSSHIFDDEGVSCYLKEGYICFWMSYICEEHDIDLERVFDNF